MWVMVQNLSHTSSLVIPLFISFIRVWRILMLPVVYFNCDVSTCFSTLNFLCWYLTFLLIVSLKELLAKLDVDVPFISLQTHLDLNLFSLGDVLGKVVNNLG